MSRLSSLGHRLYTGEVSYDFVGRQKRWYAVSAVILALALAALLIRGLNFGIEFEGGAEYRVTGAKCSVEQAREAVGRTFAGEPIVQSLGNGTIRAQTGPLEGQQADTIRRDLAETCGVQAETITSNIIGPTWGDQITRKALMGLGVFLLLVVAYLSFAFEWKMAIAAIVALLHDLLITVGIYALIGFDVTPASVIGLLTILGYSLYDTVVVFDKVRENTAGIRGGSRMTYSQAANLAVNQTLVRSVNTSVIALLPVAAILFVGAGFLGAGTLKDLSLALFVGIAAGTYSSIFIATPLLADLKEREPDMRALARRVAARGGGPARSRAFAGATAAGDTGGASAPARSGRAAARGDVQRGGGGAGDTQNGDVGIGDAGIGDADLGEVGARGADRTSPSDAPGPARPGGSAPGRRVQPSRRPSGRPSGKKRRR